jgi:hypothetical protein
MTRGRERKYEKEIMMGMERKGKGKRCGGRGKGQ